MSFLADIILDMLFVDKGSSFIFRVALKGWQWLKNLLFFWQTRGSQFSNKVSFYRLYPFDLNFLFNRFCLSSKDKISAKTGIQSESQKSNPFNLFAFFFIFMINFQLMAQSNSSSNPVIKEECDSQSSAITDQALKKADIQTCIKSAQEEQHNIMSNAITCSLNLVDKYELDEEALKNSSSEDSEIEEDEYKVTLVKLKKDCRKEKQSTEECCSNPNSCNGLSFMQNILPVVPALYSAYKSYKISDSASKGELTHQEAMDKMCNAQNIAAMGSFGMGLMSQLGSAFKKTCGDKIAKCKTACNSKVDEFKKDFKNCYAKLIPNKKNIRSMVSYAQKNCFDIDSLKNETFEFKPNNEALITNPKENKCFFSTGGKGFQHKPDEPDNKDDNQNSALAWLLYIAQAYQNTSINQVARLDDKSNEEQIIDCGNQPNRTLASSSKPAGPISPPAVQMCKQAVDYAVKNSGNSPPMPSASSTGNQGQMQQIGSLAGNTNTQGARLGALQVPKAEECEYGIVDSAKLEECNAGGALTEEDFETSRGGPGLAKNLPGWESGGGGSPGSSSGGGGIGGGLGGAGSLGGDDPSIRGGGSPYGYNGDMSAGANFGRDGFATPYGSEGGSGGVSQRDIAESSGDTMLDRSERPFEDEQDSSSGKSIFQLASERIQTFCVDHFCDE